MTGTNGQTINAFNQGQLPTYINLTGSSGFGFNDNARVSSRSTLDIFKISGEFGYQFSVQENVVLKPYGGIFYRHSQLRNSTTLDTDFRGNTFFNTLDEKLTLDQFGADIGLDIKFHLAPKYSFSLGGHVGLAHTNGRYSGNDCGDGNRFVAGCDGALFLNNGVGASNNSVDVFGGIKAALTAYVFCHNNPAVVAAVAIDAAVQALKNSCVEIGVTGTYDNYPSQTITRATAIGGGSVGLVGDREQYGTVMIGMKIRF